MSILQLAHLSLRSVYFSFVWWLVHLWFYSLGYWPRDISRCYIPWGCYLNWICWYLPFSPAGPAAPVHLVYNSALWWTVWWHQLLRALEVLVGQAGSWESTSSDVLIHKWTPRSKPGAETKQTQPILSPSPPIPQLYRWRTDQDRTWSPALHSGASDLLWWRRLPFLQRCSLRSPPYQALWQASIYQP